METHKERYLLNVLNNVQEEVGMLFKKRSFSTDKESGIIKLTLFRPAGFVVGTGERVC